MASTGYMTEADMESIWDFQIATAKFALINTRMGEIINFHVRKDRDAQTDITETKVTPILKQLAEEALIELLSSAKTIDHPIPVEYVTSHAVSVMSSVIRKNYWTIRAIKEVLESKTIIKYSNKLTLPSHSD